MRIVPMKDLCKTNRISALCQDSPDPIYVTKNGYANLVIMSAQAYEAKLAKLDAYEKLLAGLQDTKSNEQQNAFDYLNELKVKYAK